MDKGALSALAARVEAGSGCERILDRDVALALGWWPDNLAPHIVGEQPKLRSAPLHLEHAAPHWTSSLDAVVALIAERLPDWYVDNLQQIRGEGYWTASLGKTDDVWGQADTAPRALLSAFLNALAAQQQDRQTEGASHD